MGGQRRVVSLDEVEVIARLTKPRLSPRVFSKATKIISLVLKTVPPFDHVNIVLICRYSCKDTLKDTCSFN